MTLEPNVFQCDNEETDSEQSFGIKSDSRKQPSNRAEESEDSSFGCLVRQRRENSIQNSQNADAKNEDGRHKSDHASEEMYLSNSENQTSFINDLGSDPSENVRS